MKIQQFNNHHQIVLIAQGTQTKSHGNFLVGVIFIRMVSINTTLIDEVSWL